MVPGADDSIRKKPAQAAGSSRRPPRPQRTLALSNRQDVRPLDLRLLRQILWRLLRRAWPGGSFDLAVCILAAPEMTRLNETFLRHRGPTDVITFDYADKAGQAPHRPRSGAANISSCNRPDASSARLHGEIVVCLDEAIFQARRFHTSWQSELVRYIAHGLLHLLGYDDAQARARREMKAAEHRLARQLAREFDFSRLSRRG